MGFQDKVVVVTGASRGIGRATALEFGRQGAAVVVNFLKDAAAAASTAREISAAGGQAAVHQADVSDYSAAEELIKYAVQEFGGLHILVNNAGITRDGLIMMMSEADWDVVQSTNLKSTFNCSRAAVRHMLRKHWGRVINIASVAGQIGNAGQTNYSASKAGQIGFTKALAREVASRGITVNAIAAGYIETDIWAHVPEAARQAALKLIPLGRTGQPEEIAKAVAFLASDDAGYITGHVLTVDGGMAMF
jgi:3-oxoacyl-[acyl-carrier protein] reductase